MSGSLSKRRTALTVKAADSLSEIFLVDSRFERLASGVGSLEAEVGPGLYKARFRCGQTQADSLIEVGAGTANRLFIGPKVQFATPVPIPDTATWRQDHEDAARSLSRADVLSKGSSIFLFIRGLSGEAVRPWAGVSLHSLDGSLLAGPGQGTCDADSGFFALNFELAPGTYRLRVEEEPGEIYEMFVVALAGWQTQIFALAEPAWLPGVDACRAALPTAAVLMAELGKGFDPADPVPRQTELLRLGLLHGRKLLNEAGAEELLRSQPLNPMIAVFAVQHLLRQEESQPLTAKLVGQTAIQLVELPDIRAALLTAAAPLAFPEPPMLSASWQLIIAAVGKKQAEIPPGSLNSQLQSGMLPTQLWLIHRQIEHRDSVLERCHPSHQEENIMAVEAQNEEVIAELQEFADNPTAFMNRLPLKQDRQGKGRPPLFDQAALAKKDYVMAKDELRRKETDLNLIADGRAAFAANDRADSLVDSFRCAGLESMEENGLMCASLPVQPWSDDYWAIHLGILGCRYADPGFPGSPDWKDNYDHIQRNPAAAILAGGSATALDLLSPSEKYDILVGDKNFSLTKQMWADGKTHYLKHGKVETWMGICHGWAVASYMLPRPTRSVQALSADGRTLLTFYPSDIKALASLLWARCAPKSRFIGGRCNDLSPAADPESGRILAEKCFDTNPGTWHLAVVNQIGASGRSMVMDATYDYQVWNQPVVGYSYRYFNPQSRRPAASLAAATVAKAAFTNDRFKKYRSGAADSFIGIVMEVSYAVETKPGHNASDSPDDDSVKTVKYLYDLELDAVGKIIGGEWHQNAHPDFLWTPPKGSRALPPWESRSQLAEVWQVDRPVPQKWPEVAAITAEYSKAPLAAIVDVLIAAANN